MTRTITAPNLVQSQRWGCDSTSSVLAFSLFSRSEQLDCGEHVQKLWSRTIAIRWNNASINSAGNWRQYAGFQVEIQKKRGSGCSVPTPALPGANSHWISGEPRGGEQTQTAPLLEMTLKMVAKYSRQIKGDSPKRCTRRAARYPHQQTRRPSETWTFTSTPTSQAVHFFHACRSGCHREQTRAPNRNPDFHDTCDGGVLIGKLPCTSTLAQSVAIPAATARGAPALWSHERSTFVSWGGKQRSSNVFPHPVHVSLSVATVTPKQGTVSRSAQPDKTYTPPLLHLPQAENSTAWRPPLGSQLNNTGD